MNRIQKETSGDRHHQTLQTPESRPCLKTTKGHFFVATFLCVVMSAMFSAFMYLLYLAAGLPSREYRRTVVADSSCLDGSPAVFYKREPNINTFTGIVHLQGGGWCDTDASCAIRSRTGLGSSLWYPAWSSNPDSYGADLLFKSFPTWNHYSVAYCNGGSWLHPALGKETLENTLKSIVPRNDRILLTGCSAGGLGVVHACRWVMQRFRDTHFLCLNDGSLFFGNMSKMIQYHGGDVSQPDGKDVIVQDDRMLTVTDVFDWDFATSQACRDNEGLCTNDELVTKQRRVAIIKRLDSRVWWSATSQHCRLGSDMPASLRRRIILDLNVTHR